MNEVLSYLKISCVASGDDIFKPTRARKDNAVERNSKTVTVQVQNTVDASSSPDMSGLDKRAIEIYKRIPIGEECVIESLVSDDLSLRDIMRGLLKLEMGRFVTMLPGERGRRNF